MTTTYKHVCDAPDCYQDSTMKSPKVEGWTVVEIQRSKDKKVFLFCSERCFESWAAAVNPE